MLIEKSAKNLGGEISCGLNPYSNGICSLSQIFGHIYEAEAVLILILMEYAH